MGIRDITLGQYAPRNSTIHRLDPRTKVLISLFFMFLAMLLNLTGILFMLGIGLFLFRFSDLPFTTALRNARSFFWLFFLTFCIHAFFTEGRSLIEIPVVHAKMTFEGANNGIFYTIRMIVLIVYANLFTLTTSPMEITDAMEKLMKPVRRIGIPVHEIAMMISISIRFIPIFLEEGERIKNAQISRGSRFEGHLANKIRSILPIIIPLFLSSFRKADDLAMAMDARCYRGGENRTSYRSLKFRGADRAAFIIAIFIGCTLAGLRWA